jgi:hypothetical protein
MNHPLPETSAPAVSAETLSHLNVLALLHKIAGGLLVLFACFPLIHMLIGVLLVLGVIDGQAAQQSTLEEVTHVEEPATMTQPEASEFSGAVAASVSADEALEASEQMIGALFLIAGLFFFLLGQGVAVCVFLTGRFIKQRRHWTFCIVMSALACSAFPLGTLLGVFTLVLLLKPEVKSLFQKQKVPQATRFELGS